MRRAAIPALAIGLAAGLPAGAAGAWPGGDPCAPALALAPSASQEISFLYEAEAQASRQLAASLRRPGLPAAQPAGPAAEASPTRSPSELLATETRLCRCIEERGGTAPGCSMLPAERALVPSRRSISHGIDIRRLTKGR